MPPTKSWHHSPDHEGPEGYFLGGSKSILHHSSRRLKKVAHGRCGWQHRMALLMGLLQPVRLAAIAYSILPPHTLGSVLLYEHWLGFTTT